MLILLAFSWKSLSYEIFKPKQSLYATEVKTVKTPFRIILKALKEVRSKERERKRLNY